jgi:predicted nucleotidyltransferase component of viral defense system
MLRKETVSETTLGFLNKLMQDEFVKEFFLVGGTALALQIGHRISIDIDLFSLSPFDAETMLPQLEANYQFKLDFESKNTLKGEIEGIKVDLITHAYPLVKPLIFTEGIRVASLEDISAMKLNAIAGNGTRLKDFIDIAYLSSQLPLLKMVDSYENKYTSRNPAIVVKALDYHKDINFNEKIKMLDDDYSWKNIEARLKLMTLHPQQVFPQRPREKEAQELEPKPKHNRGLGI